MFSAARSSPALTERRRDQGILSRVGQFFDAHPNLPDRMLALGTGLLAGQNWSQGLALGGQNVLAVQQDQHQQQYQQDVLAQREEAQKAALKQAEARTLLDQARLEADLASKEAQTQYNEGRLDIMRQAEARQAREASMGPMATPAHSQLGNTYVDAEGNWIREVFNPNSGQSKLINLSTGQPVQTLPKGASRAEQSGVQYRSKAEVEAQTKAAQAAEAAHGRIAKLEQLREVGTKIAGPEAWNMVGRTLSEWTGTGWMDTDDVTMAKYLVSDQVLTEVGRLRGLGHMSDREFAAIRGIVANPETMTPETLNAVIDNLAAGHRRSIELYEGWRSADPRAREGGFLDYSYDWQRRMAQGEGVAPAAVAQPTPPPPEIQALLDKYAPVQQPEPAPNWGALAAEAEAYAGQAKIDQLMRKKQALGASGSW